MPRSDNCDMIRIFATVALIAGTATSMACGSGTTPSAMQGTVTVTFNGLSTNGTQIGNYTESDFSLSANPGNWVAVTTYGRPAPFIEFFATNANAVTGQVTVFA